MATSGTNPTSTLLQDKLREKKAQTQRVKKTYDPSNYLKNGLDDRDIQSSPIPSMSARDRTDAHSRRGSGIGIRSVTSPKEMGFKETEEYITKIDKMNFNLKLEIYHCRERNKVLETKLEKFQQLEADNQELQSINEELLLELEKRDVAIQQAVNLICELEAKNEDLETAIVKLDFSQLPSSTDQRPANEGNEIIASSLSTISGTKDSGPSHQSGNGAQTDLQPLPEHSLSAPDTLSPPKGTSARRLPSFMRDNKRSTTVLRSMYSSDGNASFVSLNRPLSLLSGDFDDDDRIDRQMSNSPQLSILSESGFESVYGRRKGRETDGEDGDAEPHLPQLPSLAERNTQRDSRLHRWLDERNMPRTPSPKGAADEKISSIGEILNQGITSSRDRNPTEYTVAQHPREQRTPEKRQSKQARSPEKRSSSPSFAGPIFGAAVLPPTPDTMSTVTLDANSSTPSIITEKSVHDSIPYPAKGYSALLPDTRPHTSGSTNGSASTGSLRDTNRQDMSTRSDARGTSGYEAPRRPSLTIYASDTFSGDTLSSTQASRTLSYPSPKSRARRLSGQRSPQSYSDKTVDQPAQERLRSGSAVTITPTRRTARDDRSPLSPQEASGPSQMTALPHLAASPPANRSSSLRSKIVSKFSRSTNNTTRIPNLSSNVQDSTPSRPPVTRAPASTQPARPSRPASLSVSGQHPVPRPSPSRTYNLSPMIPDEMTMLTDLERYSAGSARNFVRRRDRK